MSQSDDINKLIEMRSRYLQKLKEKQASMGLATLPHILIEIEDTEEEIQTLQKQLAAIQPQVQHTNIGGDAKNVMNPLRECMEYTFMEEDELRQFCQDNFKFVYRRLKNTDRWDHIVGQIILYCEARGKSDDLWDLLKLKNPSVYEQFVHYRYK